MRSTSSSGTLTAGAPLGTMRDVWLLSIGHGLTHWYPATFLLLLPFVGKELGLSYSQIGFIMTSQYIVGAISNIPGGMIVDTAGRKGPLLALSLFWIGFPYFLMNFSASYWFLLACVALVGIGNNLWHPAAISMLGERYPDRKGLVLSLHGMGGNFGDAVAPLVVGWLLTMMSWRSIVVTNLIPGLVMALVILALIGGVDWRSRGKTTSRASAEPLGPRLTAYVRDMLKLLKNRALALISLGSAFRTMTASALATFLPVFLAYELGYSPLWVGIWMAVLQGCGFVAAPMAGHLSDRMGPRRVILSSMVLTAVVLVAMAVAGRSPAFVMLIALLGFFLHAVRSVMQAWLLDITPRHMAGTSVGLLFGAQAIGSGIGPLAGGVLADHFGLMSVFYFLAVTIVIANVLTALTPDVRRQREGADPSY